MAEAILLKEELPRSRYAHHEIIDQVDLTDQLDAARVNGALAKYLAAKLSTHTEGEGSGELIVQMDDGRLVSGSYIFAIRDSKKMKEA